MPINDGRNGPLNFEKRAWRAFRFRKNGALEVELHHTVRRQLKRTTAQWPPCSRPTVALHVDPLLESLVAFRRNMPDSNESGGAQHLTFFKQVTVPALGNVPLSTREFDQVIFRAPPGLTPAAQRHAARPAGAH